MPAPSLITDLSQTAGSNQPVGSVDTPSTLDDVQRAHASFIAMLRDGVGFTNPATLASATTTSIGGVSSLSVEITGTTTITSFGTTYNGPRFLRFQGALTLTHSSSLNLPGAANITTAAGDTCIAIPNQALSGWNVYAYQPAAANAVTFLQAGTGAVSRSVQSKERDTISVFDFLTAAQISDVQARTATLDVTTAVQAAIDAVRTAGGGALLFPYGLYKITATLTSLETVFLVGEGQGRFSQPAITAASELAWYGGASEMVKFGHGAATKATGGIKRMRLNGRAIATKCLSIKDFQHGTFNDLQLVGAITSALYLTNTDTYDPTGFCEFDNLQISLRGNSTDSAHGIHLDGVGTGASGVTKNKFFAPRIEHANGNGLHLGLRADSNTFVDFFAYRANTTETGYGIRFSSTDTGAINTTNKFLGSTIAVGGISIALPSGVTSAIGIEGTSFESVNVTELASDITDRVNPGQSLGKIMLSGRTDKRYRTGFARLMNEHQGMSFDDFRFVSYTNPVLTTNQGAWTVVCNGAGGSIASALQPGGAVDLITGAAGTDDIAIYGGADFTSGITLSSNPYAYMMVAPASTATVRHQWGLFGDSTLPDPTNGVYVQFDPAVNANYQLIARKAGTSTTITTSIAGAATKRQWLVCIDPSANAVYFTKLATETQWTYLGTNSTNVPIVNLLPGFRCRAQAAANRNLHVYGCEFGHDHE